MVLLRTRSFIGGARIGTMNATWPFARLTVSTGRISLRCLRKYELSTRDVICEPYGFVPLLSGGVEFHHIRADYPSPLIFLCGGRKRVLETLRRAGFEVIEGR